MFELIWHFYLFMNWNTTEFLSYGTHDSSGVEESSPKTEVLPSINSGSRTGSVTLYWVKWTSLSPLSYHNGFKDSKMNKQGTAGKRKHVILTAPQKLWINEAWKRQKPKRGSSFTQQWATSYIRYGKLERPIIFIYGIKWKCEGPFQVTDIERA
jgi:hypothetical protein